MDDCKRSLIILLSMHRCGSSLATSILHRMGMSLGPFKLMDAAPSNPHGHFEAIPFYELNRRVQELALGFPDDLPDTPAILNRLTATQGEWPAEIQVPQSLVDEGRSLIRALIESGEVAGFKDPRTVLTWPFWQRVLEAFPDVRVVPVSLLRSPHEIAMSLVTRGRGWLSYWAALDVVAVHFRRQRAILETWGKTTPSVCFGSPLFMDTLIDVIHQCGLPWNETDRRKLYDPSCVHQTPAVVPHVAQSLFDLLAGEPDQGRATDHIGGQFVSDARYLESVRLEQMQITRGQLSESETQLAQSRSLIEQIAERLRKSESSLTESRIQLIQSQRLLVENQQTLIETQRDLILSQDRELHATRHNNALTARLDRYESHPIIGAAIRSRRHLRRFVDSISPGSAVDDAPHNSEEVA